MERDLVVAQASLWTTLDQEIASVNESQEASVNEHAQMMRYAIEPTQFEGDYMQQRVDGTRESFQLMLAEDWTKSDDGLTYTFKLKEGIASPWGNELTADDVIYTQTRKMEPWPSSGASSRTLRSTSSRRTSSRGSTSTPSSSA